MLTIVTNAAGVAAAQRQLEEAIERSGTKSGYLHIGYHGGGGRYYATWVRKFDLWFARKKLGNRYWNSFGVGNPFTSPPTIIAEINPPLRGIRRAMAGAFAIDGHGATYLIHRGNVGGGRRGIGKQAFLDRYSEPLVPVLEGHTTSEVVVVARVDGSDVLPQILRFVGRVQSIKEELSAGAPTKRSAARTPRHEFRPEFRGRKVYSARAQIEANVTHGVVVDALRAELAHLGRRAFRTQNRDLYVPSRTARLDALFEVKTDTTSTSIYTAVGQLFMHGGASKAKRLVAVIPAGLDGDRRKHLENLAVRVVTFTWKQQQPKFRGLVDALK